MEGIGSLFTKGWPLHVSLNCTLASACHRSSVLVRKKQTNAGLLHLFWRSIYIWGDSSWKAILEGPLSSGLRGTPLRPRSLSAAVTFVIVDKGKR